MTEGGNYDDAIGGDGKRKVGCEGEVDHDSDNNDNNSVDDYCGVDIKDGNDANCGERMNKTNRDDDADGGGGNCNNGGGVDENCAFDVKGGDKTDDGDEQTESVAGDLTKCNGNSKMKMKVEVMR